MSSISQSVHCKATRLSDYEPKRTLGLNATGQAYAKRVIDSIQTADMSPSDFAKLKRTYPNTSFVLVSKANKDGTFKGSSDWEHDVDAMLEVKDRYVTVGKNRFPNAVESRVRVF